MAIKSGKTHTHQKHWFVNSDDDRPSTRIEDKWRSDDTLFSRNSHQSRFCRGFEYHVAALLNVWKTER